MIKILKKSVKVGLRSLTALMSLGLMLAGVGSMAALPFPSTDSCCLCGMRSGDKLECPFLALLMFGACLLCPLLCRRRWSMDGIVTTGVPLLTFCFDCFLADVGVVAKPVTDSTADITNGPLSLSCC